MQRQDRMRCTNECGAICHVSAEVPEDKQQQQLRHRGPYLRNRYQAGDFF